MNSNQRETARTSDAALPIERHASLTPHQAFARTPSKRSIKTRTTTTERRASAHRRVLVVDDVPDVTEMIALFLTHAGFDVTTANSADRALRLTSENQFDIIISDIGMPEMNGYDLAESLRTREAYKATPMIAVTGYTEYDDRGRSLR